MANGSSATIPSGTNWTVNNLTIAPGPTLTITNNATLTVRGAVTVNGTLAAGCSALLRARALSVNGSVALTGASVETDGLTIAPAGVMNVQGCSAPSYVSVGVDGATVAGLINFNDAAAAAAPTALKITGPVTLIGRSEYTYSTPPTTRGIFVPNGASALNITGSVNVSVGAALAYGMAWNPQNYRFTGGISATGGGRGFSISGALMVAGGAVYLGGPASDAVAGGGGGAITYSLGSFSLLQGSAVFGSAGANFSSTNVTIAGNLTVVAGTLSVRGLVSISAANIAVESGGAIDGTGEGYKAGQGAYIRSSNAVSDGGVGIISGNGTGVAHRGGRRLLSPSYPEWRPLGDAQPALTTAAQR